MLSRCQHSDFPLLVLWVQACNKNPRLDAIGKGFCWRRSFSLSILQVTNSSIMILDRIYLTGRKLRFQKFQLLIFGYLSLDIFFRKHHRS